MSIRSENWTPGFTPQDVTALESVTEGDVLLAGAPSFCTEIGVGEAHAPDIALVATSTADVVAGVRFAKSFGLAITVAAPGEAFAEPAKGGLLIATRKLDSIHVDVRGRTAIAAAGAMWSDVVARAEAHGLAPLAPAYPGAGVLDPAFTWTREEVASIEVVEADGRIEHVTARTDPRRFRELRTGTIASSVITAMTFTLFR
ncbi:FAD-binding oxidoreductase [Pseudonocardia sp. TRM90224]|uniref:FAD-binding oxidoreductase n=1 Tax=Pseudonocardia sp. TRM90224 TaxID=2812678 RepID=UPI001E544CFC|nr:FAD-binding protein [Pseudonocardia sp. TRM90224]